MNEQSEAVRVALAYHRAWTNHDVDGAMKYVGADVVVEAPDGRTEGAEALRESVGHFAEVLKSATLWAAFGDEETAVLMYDTESTIVPSAPGAEHVTVRDGKIVHSRLIFDRLPFAQQAPGE
jgi:hypothetical protein